MIAARIAVLGGTFDPIHVGQMRAGCQADAALRFDRTLFIPSHVPPHRPDSPRASGYHRWQMTALAVADTPGWQASDLELVRGGASYTFDTLTTLREQEPTAQFFFITGADAFAEIATWRRYPDVLDLAHFVVIARTGTSLDRVRARVPGLVTRMVTCDGAPSRACRAAALPSIFLVSADTPDVSSTEVRRRAANGEPITGLVPDAVARYIADHHLYA